MWATTRQGGLAHPCLHIAPSLFCCWCDRAASLFHSCALQISFLAKWFNFLRSFLKHSSPCSHTSSGADEGGWESSLLGASLGLGWLRALVKLQPCLVRRDCVLFLISSWCQPLPVPCYYCQQRTSDTPRGQKYNNSRQKRRRESQINTFPFLLRDLPCVASELKRRLCNPMCLWITTVVPESNLPAVNLMAPLTD